MFQKETCQDPQIRCELAQVQTSDISVRQVGMVLPLSKALVISNRNLAVKMKMPQPGLGEDEEKGGLHK